MWFEEVGVVSISLVSCAVVLKCAVILKWVMFSIEIEGLIKFIADV